MATRIAVGLARIILVAKPKSCLTPNHKGGGRGKIAAILAMTDVAIVDLDEIDFSYKIQAAAVLANIANIGI